MVSESYLYKLEVAAALNQGRKPCEVVFANLPENYERVLSLFEKERNLIIFNRDLIDQVSELELVASLIHEGRHAYQWFQISKPLESCETVEILKEWESDFTSYKQPLSKKDILPNALQSIEIDAIAYTAIRLELIGEGKLIIPAEIADSVNRRKADLNLRKIK